MSKYPRKKYWQKVLKILTLLSLNLVLISLGFICQSCGSGSTISGIVREWTNASPWIRSDIVKPGEINLPDTLPVLSDAEIILLHSTDFTKADSVADNINVFKTKSDINGRYHLQIKPPIDSTSSVLIVRKKGYILGFKNYLDFTKSGHFYFDIYLVQERFR